MTRTAALIAARQLLDEAGVDPARVAAVAVRAALRNARVRRVVEVVVDLAAEMLPVLDEELARSAGTCGCTGALHLVTARCVTA